MLLSRRTFIQSLLAFAASGAAPSAFAKILETERTTPLSQVLVIGSQDRVCVIDLKTGNLLHQLTLGFPPHAILRSPQDSYKVWLVQRYATYVDMKKPHAPSTLFKTVEFDLRSGKVTNEIHAPAGSEYRGHALFAADNKTLFITRVDVEKAEAFLTGYDTVSHDSKVVSDIALGKTGLHECRLAADKKTAYVATTGGINVEPYAVKPRYKRFSPGSLTLVDLAAGKIRSRIDITDDAYHIGHFRVLDNGHIIATSSTDDKANRSGAVLWGHVDKSTFTTIDIPQDRQVKRSEKFDVAVHEKHQIAAVNDNVLLEIYLIDTQTGKYLEKIPIDAFGVVYDPYSEGFVVNGEQITMIDQHLKHLKDAPDYSKVAGPFKGGHSLII